MSKRRATLPPYPASDFPKSSVDVTRTIHTFIAELPLDEQRCILFYHRQHGGRQYVRWRVFHRHRTFKNWYPDKRRWFVIPIEHAIGLAEAICAAAYGEPVTAKPEWLAHLDENRHRRVLKLADLNAPPEVIDPERRRLTKGQA